MVIEIVVKELLAVVEYPSKATGEIKKRQQALVETIAPYPDEFIVDMFGKVADDYGLAVGKKVNARLSFQVDQITSTKDNSIWHKQKVVLWGTD